MTFQELCDRINLEGYAIQLEQWPGNVDGRIYYIWHCHLRKDSPLGTTRFSNFGQGGTPEEALQACYAKVLLDTGTVTITRPKVKNFHSGKELDVDSILGMLDL